MPPTKTQRWLDLLAVLLGRRLPLAVDELLQKVPAYRTDLEAAEARSEPHRSRALASLRRKFERDKSELRRLGIVLESRPMRLTSGDMGEGYRVPATAFYLPLLRVVQASDRGSPPHGSPPSDPVSHPPGAVVLTEAEARTALSALRRILALPAFPLAPEARTALGKLTFDLDPALHPSLASDLPLRVLERPGGADPAHLLPLLMGALLERKRITFHYRSPRAPADAPASERELEPYGLFFQWGSWYLVGHDAERTPPLRLYRVDRMESAQKNARRPGTADFERPEEFRISAFMDRSAWELGGEDAKDQTLVVRFLPPLDQVATRNGWGEALGTDALARLPAAAGGDLDDPGVAGDPDAPGVAGDPGDPTGSGAPGLRSFRVRARPPFLRWVLSHGGEADLVHPPDAREALQAMARRVMERHRGDHGDGVADGRDRRNPHVTDGPAETRA